MVYLQTNSYSIDVAKVFGVRSAVFLSFLFRKLSESTDKQIAIERGTIYDNTGLDENEQKSIESSLQEIKVIEVVKVRGSDTKNYYTFDEQCFLRFQTSTSLQDIVCEEVHTRATLNSKQRRTTKRDIFIKQLKSSLSITDEVLKQSLCDWIDSVYSNPKGFLSLQGLSLSVNELLAFSTNIDTLIEIMNIAIKGGLRDLTWAINKYEQTHRDASGGCWKSYSETKSDIHTENGAF